MINAFKLEQRILDCWSILEDLEYLGEVIEDNDQALNILIGIKELYGIKFNKLWDAYEASLK